MSRKFLALCLRQKMYCFYRKLFYFLFRLRFSTIDGLRSSEQKHFILVLSNNMLCVYEEYVRYIIILIIVIQSEWSKRSLKKPYVHSNLYFSVAGTNLWVYSLKRLYTVQCRKYHIRKLDIFFELTMFSLFFQPLHYAM